MAIFVNINEDYVDTGNAGNESDPLNWDEFTNVLSGGNGVPSTETYYLSGYRVTDFGVEYGTGALIVVGSDITITNWGSEPFRIHEESESFIFELYGVDSFKLQNAMIWAKYTPLWIMSDVDTTDVVVCDNCYFKDENDGLAIINDCLSAVVQNCIVYGTETNPDDDEGSFNFEDCEDVKIVNSILIGPTNFVGNPETFVTVDNCVTDVSVFGWHETQGGEVGSSAISNCQFNFSTPAALDKDISAVTRDDFYYLSGGFEDISVTGDTSYNDGVWWNGTRDGIGALYFPEPEISGVTYVNINKSYDSNTSNSGTQDDPLNWDEFLYALSGGNGVPSTETYKLSGYRAYDFTNVYSYTVVGSDITITSWGSEPFKIYNEGNYFRLELSGVDSFKIQNAMMQGNDQPIEIYGDYSGDKISNVVYDNCYLFGGDQGSVYVDFIDNITFQNCTFYGKNFDDGNGIFVLADSNNAKIVNSIIIGPTEFVGSDETILTVDNCVTNVSEFTRGFYYGDQLIDLSVTNCQFNFSQPSALDIDVSAVTRDDFNYLSGGFEDISATGDTSYNDGVWWNGTRDGIGALYFPPLSGIYISASSTKSPINSSVDFVLSGNDPFTSFSATSAIYDFDDGNTSAVNSNDVLTHSFTSNALFSVFATVNSRNEWYTFTTNTFDIEVGDFIVTIAIYKNNQDVTNSSATFFDNLTFSANTIGLDAGSYKWDFGDGTSGDSDTETKYYTSGATFTIGLSGYALENSSVSSTDTATLSISSTSAIYFVNINSSYDVFGSNVGTSDDPFNWNEFKGRVETSGDYNDTYRLSGSRNLDYGSTSNRNILSIDRRKNFTIRDWDVSAYGPWVWIVEDFSVLDENSVLSAGGCTLRNGIIYNKRYSSPGFGGKIILSRTYNMFVVYQGEYSRIQIDPMNYMLSGTTESVIVTGTSSDKPSWVEYDTYIFEDYNYEDLGCGNVNPFWSSGVSAGSFSAVDTPSFTGCVRYGDDTFDYNTQSTCFSGGFVIETQMFIGNPGGNRSVHLFLNEQNGTEILDFQFAGGNRIEYDSELVTEFNNEPGYYIWFKIERESGSNVISASYKHDFNETVSAAGETTGVYYFAGSAEYSGCSYVTGNCGENAWGTGPLYWQAEYGFPETWTSGTSSTTSGVDSAGYIVASAGSNIIGSTIYLSGDGWSDYFNSATYSAFDQSDYNVSIIDSVITNLTKETSEQFSACGLILMNSTFSNSYSTISGNFTVETNDENQFGWIPPTDYPFTPNNALYNKDIDFINSNKKYLKPFDGITTPPNPGRNYDTYPNYETGLFGYSRKDYDLL